MVSKEVGVEGPVGSGVRGSGAEICGGDGTIARRPPFIPATSVPAGLACVEGGVEEEIVPTVRYIPGLSQPKRTR